MKNKKVCRVKGCDSVVIARKLCRLHYLRLRRLGYPGEASRRKAPNGTYSRFINDRRVWHDKKTKSEYMKKLRERCPEKYKSVKYMHKKRFGGLRQEVLERDNYTCQICEMTDGEHRRRWNCEITLDHIDGSGRYSDTHNHRVSNLWTLCLPCHGRRDVYRWLLSKGKTVPYDLIQSHRLDG